MNANKEHNRRLIVCNDVLATFSPAKIESRAFYWAVSWPARDGKRTMRRWSVVKGNDFYPPWHRMFPGGGTSITALAQLVRWLQRRPIFPVATWHYWSGDNVALLPRSAVDDLAAGGYPEIVPCVLCGRTLTSITGIDWWRHDGLTGPCCGHLRSAGCGQQPGGECLDRDAAAKLDAADRKFFLARRAAERQAL